MTRVAEKRRFRKEQSRHARELRGKAQNAPKKVTSHTAIYGGLLLIGFFFVVLAGLLLDHWLAPAVFYLAIVAYEVNASTWQVYRGMHLPNWQQALAKIPLQFVGYGTKEGKPLEAAHDHASVRNALIISMLISVVVVGALAALTINSL
jgi:hypothetical protein